MEADSMLGRTPMAASLGFVRYAPDRIMTNAG
jgi:hypothetical protein